MAVAASGWIPSNVQVLQSRVQSKGQTEALVQLTLEPSQWQAASGTGQLDVPGYFAVPAPQLVGLNRLSYVIPICPFYGLTAAGRWMVWGWTAPPVSGGVAAAPNGGIHVIGVGGIDVSGGPSVSREPALGSAVSSVFTSDTYRAYALFVGG